MVNELTDALSDLLYRRQTLSSTATCHHIASRLAFLGQDKHWRCAMNLSLGHTAAGDHVLTTLRSLCDHFVTTLRPNNRLVADWAPTWSRLLKVVGDLNEIFLVTRRVFVAESATSLRPNWLPGGHWLARP